MTPSPPSAIVGLLLAAGASRRFGTDKLMQPLPDGTPVAVAACRSLRAGVGSVLAVVRPGQDELAARLRAEGATTAVCAAAIEGMGASLAFAVASTGAAGGWLVALADMPAIAPETIRRVAAAVAAGAVLAAPFHRGRRGHPVGFGRRFGPELKGLTGDEGARALLARNRDLIEAIAVDDPGILLDIDAPADLAFFGRSGAAPGQDR